MEIKLFESPDLASLYVCVCVQHTHTHIYIYIYVTYACEAWVLKETIKKQVNGI